MTPAAFCFTPVTPFIARSGIRLVMHKSQISADSQAVLNKIQ